MGSELLGILVVGRNLMGLLAIDKWGKMEPRLSIVSRVVVNYRQSPRRFAARS